MRNKRRKHLSRNIGGFTLLELLVVLAVITVLISLLLPVLNRAREAARAVTCASNMRQIGVAYQLYLNQSQGVLMMLESMPSDTLPNDPVIGFYFSRVTWPDTLRRFVQTKSIFSCPSAADSILPGYPRLGIGLNHIGMSYSSLWTLGSKKLRISQVKEPARTVFFADSGQISNYMEINPDKWVEIPGQSTFYFLTPDHGGFYDPPIVPRTNGQRRPVNRHRGVCVTGFVDGHVEQTKVSTFGLQFFPGIAPNGKPATGDSIRGGNDRYDSRWLWDRF